MNTNFKFQNNTLFIFGIWDKTSIYKLKIKDFLDLSTDIAALIIMTINLI